MVRLATIGSTRVGGLYRDGGRYITPGLTAAIDAIARDMAQFHFGRFDVRFAGLDQLAQGCDFRIMEVNGAGSEAIEAWDPDTGLAAALRIIFAKQRVAFAIGAANRRQGLRPIGLRRLAGLHFMQQRLLDAYPAVELALVLHRCPRPATYLVGGGTPWQVLSHPAKCASLRAMPCSTAISPPHPASRRWCCSRMRNGGGRHSARDRLLAARLQQAGIATLLFDAPAAGKQDQALLAQRMQDATAWAGNQSELRHAAIGYVGAGQGSSAALIAAARLGKEVVAVVSLGGRVELAGPAVLAAIKASTC